jgi:hypothetical protein
MLHKGADHTTIAMHDQPARKPLPSSVNRVSSKESWVGGSGRPKGSLTRVKADVGLVSRVTPVQTAMRNCTRDEGRSFEVGNQVLISNHRKLLWSKATVVNVAEKSEQDSGRYDWERRAQANRCRSVESGLDDAKTGG